MLILLMSLLLGGGGLSAGVLTPAAVKEIAQRVQASVGDTERVEAAAAVLRQLRSEVKAFDKIYGKDKQLTRLYRDHGAEAAAMLDALDELNAEWEASQTRILDLRFELLEILTAEEWAEVFAPDAAD